MQDLIVFSDIDDHPLAFLLEPGFRHVTAVRCVSSISWVQYDWSPQEVKLSPFREVDHAYLIDFYRDHGGLVLQRPVTLRRWASAPLTLNNCVGHTKSILGIPSMALTPYQLYRHLQKEQR